MSVHAFVFPGQGSQSIGMGQGLYEAFPAAREVFQEVDDALGEHLSKLIFAGEASELTRTENTQPALMAVSLATVRVLESEGGFSLSDKATVVAGHSLGEYSALAAAGALGIAQTARLLRLRGLAMQEAVPAGEGGMAALLGVEAELAHEICAEAARLSIEGEADRHETIELANDNGGGQIVVSGRLSAVERAIALAKAKGVKRAVMLPVSAPFHSSLMGSAAERMAEALERAEIATPLIPVITNVTAGKNTDATRIPELLVQQVTGSVRWRESVLAMAAMGVTSQVELGAGKVLTGLVRRIAPDMTARNAGTPEEIEALLRDL
ncbi:ACP S-malonyltransferase [Asaia sp. VD9]|uniref:ACP S-malonyltransferase n=1 Tax=Asaia sp. VD9 TaxID=3081235 RepID=UPI003017E315